ncbi:hypothetical protein [Streptomyces sodiiphilus]|uniref:hypothetical protein n=1 Tax=Streptomyces sodiiphilus TaxID=226217 RepID=UPI0031E25C89
MRRFPRLGFAVGLFLLILAFPLVLALLLIFPAGLFFRGQPPLPDLEFLPVVGLVVGGALLAAAAMWLYDRLYLSDDDREETRYDRALNRVLVWLGIPLIACFIVFDVLYPFSVLGLALL